MVNRRLADTQPSPITSEAPPVLSEGTVNAWVIYDTSENPDHDPIKEKQIEREQARSIETAQVFFDFGGSKGLVSSALEAAPLVGLMFKLNSSDEMEAIRAETALSLYESDNKDEIIKQQDIDYVRAMAGDIAEIDIFVDKHFRTALKKYKPGYDEELNPWKYKHDLIPLTDALELVSEKKTATVKRPKGVNIESVLLGASSAFVTLRYAKEFSDFDVLKAIYSIDKFYRPFLTFIGFDGKEAALDEQAERTRMKYGESLLTEQDFEKARAILKKAGLSNPEETVKKMNQIVTRLFPSGADAVSVLSNTSGHNLQFGVGHIYGEEREAGIVEDDSIALDDDTLEFNWRVKPEKSIAEQVHIDPDLYISDLLGLTIKTPNYDVIADKMAVALGVLHEVQSLDEKNSASRDTHIHLKGKDVIQAVLPILEKNLDGFEWHIDQKPSPNGHQVAKITFGSKSGTEPNVIETPVELMLQTTADRDISRFGKAAHIRKSETPVEVRKDEGYKAGTTEEIDAGQDLNERRTMLTEVRLTEQSKRRAERRFSDVGKHKRRLGAAGIRKFFLSEDSGTL